MKFFDSHCHFNDEKFDDDRDTIIKEAYNQDINKMVTVGYDIKSSEKAIEIANNYDCIYATVRNISK